ncbi:MAG: toxin TcdB middle/N-terminal domain-containing protein [Deltaproteobacteria bacterium]
MCSREVCAQDRSGVRPQVLSLPTGPGSIEGLGESFEPSESTGTSSFQVGLAFPPAVAGFGPSLALGYSSGGGNTELGLGWSLGLPTVQRGTDRGLPRYDVDDVFILRGLGGATEDIVQLPDGSYRYRIEGGFVRGRQRDDGSWEFRSRDGTRHRFGTDPSATIADDGRVFAWCLTEQEDTHGNVIRYEHERDEMGRPYLARIVYNDFSPAVRNEVQFEYEGRPDAITSFVSTFPVTLARRLRAVVIRHGGETIRRYDLTYRMTGGISRLSSVEVVGRDSESRLPSIQFEYAELVTDAMRVVEMSEAPARALGDVTEITDVDGDALPDLLVADPGLEGGRYSYYPNVDGSRFGPRRTLEASPSVWLASPEVQLADMDGDGAADVVARISANADGFRFYPSAGIGTAGFGARVDVAPNVPTPLSDADTQLVDLDHDRLVDWLRTDPTSGLVSVGFNLGGGRFSSPVDLPALDDSSLVTFSRGAKLADVNGDSLQDIIEVRDGSARVFFATGFGRFTEPVSLTGAPALSDTERAELQVRDVSGDGLADLVHVGASQVRVWLGMSGRGFDAPILIRGTPARRPTTVIRVADVNGNGSGDIVWVDPADTSAPWRYLDLLADGSPGLLTRIDNGLGRVHRISYAGLGAMWGWAREIGIEPTHRCSAGQTVVAGITIEDGISPPMVTELRYADAYFDGPSREFRGFAIFEGRDLGDASQPTLVTEQRFDVGETDEARKGLPLSSRRFDESGRVFDELRHVHTLLEVASDARGEPIVFAYESRTETTIIEGTSAPITLVSERERDRFGNETRVVEWGVFDEADPNAGRDERVTTRTFADNESTWILGAVASERVEDLAGRRFSESRTYYDGEPYEGLPLGEVERGDVSRTERWIEGDRWQTETRQRFDSYGNVVEDVDSRGARHWVEWDEESHTFPEREREQVAHGIELQWRAEHDRAFGVVTAVFEPNDEVRRFSHDAFGRLIATYEPGDPEDDPTRSFEYLYGNPISTIRERTSARDHELVTIHHVDGLGRIAGVFFSAGEGLWHTSEVTSYGPRGFKTRVLYPSERRNADVPSADEDLPATRFVHDAIGRLLEEVEVDGSVRRSEYLPLVTITSDPNDADETSVHFDSPTTIRTDGLERIVSVTRREDERRFETTYTYDPLDNLAGFVDARGSVRSYVYDGLSRPTRVEDPNAGTWRWVYNESDVRERIDPLGNVMRYEVDLAGRRIREFAREADWVRLDSGGRIRRYFDHLTRRRWPWRAGSGLGISALA